MKKIINCLFTTLSNEQIENLTREVITDIDFKKTKVFTSADLWNIQRQGRNRVQRRPSF